MEICFEFATMDANSQFLSKNGLNVSGYLKEKRTNIQIITVLVIIRKRLNMLGLAAAWWFCML